MNRKTIVTVALVCIALFAPLSVFSQSQDFEISDMGFYTKLEKYRGNASNVTIPNGTTIIGYGAFAKNTRITSVIIPAGITTIEKNAFEGCTNLISITIPSSVTSIGEGAFNGTAWLNSQPNGLVYAGKVLYIYKGTMPANTVINNIRTDTVAIANGAFKGCTSLKSVTLPASVAFIGCSPWNYKFYESGVFEGCTSLSSVNIPAGVTTIRDRTFLRCKSLASITIPAGVTSIGDETFYGCTSLTGITVDTQNKNYSSIQGVLFNKSGTILVIYPQGRQDKTYTIPAGVKSIADWAFDGCGNIIGITIPAGLTTIGEGAFYECTNLTSINIPASVTSVGYSAFFDCPLPSSVENDIIRRFGEEPFEDDWWF